MPTYLFYQKVGGPTSWECALAGERERLAVQDKVEFITVLDVDHSFATELTPDETASVKYGAPLGFYMDFDGDIDEVLGQSKLLLLKLQDEAKFDITQARIYLTGGRGVHIEIPLACFAQKIPPAGIPMLPAIFKEIAMAIYVDTLDTRIYSGKRGRMWRVPNVKRGNGLYKVQVTVDEFLDCTPEAYAAICATPRAPLPLTPPTFNPHLGLLYMQAQEKVGVAVKRRKQIKKTDGDVSRFEGQWPKSVQLLLMGEALRPTAGWNQIALQLAAFAIALGKTEDQFIEEARELILAHQGDSDRYGTPKKREREMRNQYRYQDDNPGYSFSLGGVKSLFAKGISTADLDWTGVDAGAEDDMPPADDDEAGGDDEGDGEPAATSEDAEKISTGKKGTWVLTDKGPVKVSELGFTKGEMLNDLDGEGIGFEWDIWVGGDRKCRALIPLSMLTTKASFAPFCTRFKTSFKGNDAHVAELIDFMRRKTEKTGSVVYTLPREGVDLFRKPHANPEQFEIVWAGPEGCSHTSDTSYVFRGLHVESGSFQSDLMSAPDLEDTPEMREFIDNLLSTNAPATLGKVLGWFSAAFMCQLIRHINGNAFPMLQIWGEAGAGKSATALLFSNIHYYRREPRITASAGNTFFPMLVAVTQSASIPVVFEEMKPRQMSKHQLDSVQNLMRTNYTGTALERGALDKDKNGGVQVRSYANRAPIAFIGESIETQTAIHERCVSVAMSKLDRKGCSEAFDYCERRSSLMGVIGKSLAMACLTMDLDDLHARFKAVEDVAKKEVGLDTYERLSRMLKTHVVVMLGLELLKSRLHSVFGSLYDERLDGLIQAVYACATDAGALFSMSEAAKTLDVLAQLTRVQDVQYRLEKNQDYVVRNGGVDIRMRPAYAKYVRYQTSIKQEVLYDNDRAFLEGMRKYAGLVSDKAPDSPLFRSAYEPLFRFKVESMHSDGCEPFEP